MLDDQYSLLDDILKQAHIVDQRANALAADMVAVLEDSLKDVVDKLNELQTGLQFVDFEDLSIQAKIEYLQQQRAQIENVLQDVYARMKPPMLEAGQDIFSYTQKAVTKTLAPFLALSIGGSALAIYAGEPILHTDTVAKWFEMSTVEGLTVNEWLKKLEANAAQRIIKAGRQAMIEGLSIPQTMRLMKKEGIEGSIPGLQGLARTYCLSASNYAKEETIKEKFNDIIEGWQYLATLDGRTCPVCGADDKRKFKIDEKRPGLPRHWNCRCTYLPIVDINMDDIKLSEKGRQGILEIIRESQENPRFKKNRAALKKLEEYYKAAEYEHRPALQHSKRTVHHRDGSSSTKFTVKDVDYVPQNMSYNDWLKRMLEKDPAFVRGILGKTRFELFQSGKITLKNMSTNGKLKKIADLI